MNAAMWTAKTGVQAQDAKLQAIANNLANVNTTGFKRDRVVFEDLFYQVERQPGAAQAEGMNTPVGVQLGNGVRVAGTQKVFTTGSLQTTGQPLDIAIQGQGFLQVELPGGETAYTRAGQLQRSPDVPADHRARDHAQLTTKAADKIPNQPAFECLRCVYPCGAVRADGSAGRAVAVAPAERPLGKGDEPFFSASSSKPLAT